MPISPEGKIGIFLGLLSLAGAGAMMVFPQHTEIGWALIVISVVGFILLAFHHYGLGQRRMIPLLGMLVSSLVFVGCAAWYFWPPAQYNAPHGDASDAIFDIGGAKNTTVENNRIVGGIGNRKAFNIQGKETTVVRGNEVIEKVPEPKAQQNIEFIGLSNADLKKVIVEFTGQMRQFEIIYDKNRSYVFSRPKSFGNRSAEQLKQDSEAAISEYERLGNEKKHEFDATLLPRARAIEGEILWRLQLAGVTKVEWPNDFAHRTIAIGYKQFQFDSLAGASPVADMADYLDYLASLLHA